MHILCFGPFNDPDILDAKNWEYGMSLSHDVVRALLNSLAQIFVQQTFLVFTFQEAVMSGPGRRQNHIRISGWSSR